jgi:hypothetical protein
LTFTPAPNASVATIGVTVQDNGGTANGGIDTSASQTARDHRFCRQATLADLSIHQDPYRRRRRSDPLTYT